jgi:adenylate kinase family enzyme
MSEFPFQRILVVGATGSGKTTLASRLAGILGVPHVEMDALHWKPGWEHVGDEDMCNLVDVATRAEAWVLDGNYGVTREIVWPRAQAVAWLDLPLLIVFW